MQTAYRVLLDVVDHATINAVLDRLKSFDIALNDSLFANTRHKAVLRIDLEVFVCGLGCPLIVFCVQT